MTLEHYKAQEETARQFKALQDQLAASRALCERLQAQADEMRSACQWISVEDRLPVPNTQVLAFYVNSHGKGRRVRGEWIARHTVEASDDAWGDGADYDEATDNYYSPAGWYECVDNWDELAYLFINEGPVTHWMPLPAAPTPTNGVSHD